jgi:phenylalanyl-tRNA synthetase beta chain
VSFTAEDIARLIQPIGFVVVPVEQSGSKLDAETLMVTVPSWRPDCTLEIDIVEEVARHFGYSNVGRSIPKSTLPGGLSPAQQRRRKVRDILHGLGIHEAMPHPFLTDGDLLHAGLSDVAVRLVNPLAVGDDVLRTSVRPGLLKALAFNESHRRSGLAFFEIGHVYPPSTEVLPNEFEQLGIVIADADAAAAVRIWRELSTAMGWGARLDQSNVPAGLHPTRSATLSLGKSVIGSIGEVHPEVVEAFGITERVAVLELDLSQLLTVQPKIPQWKPVSRFPSSDFDLAFLVPTTVAADRVEKALRQAAGALLVDVVLFDVYRSAELVDERGLAFRLRLQAVDRTLTDQDVTGVREKCIAAVAKVGAILRS